MMKVLRQKIKDVGIFLATLALIFALITSIFQIGLDNTLYALAILTIFALFWIVLYQHMKIKELKNKVKDRLADGELVKYLNECENPNLKIETIKQTTHIKGVNVSVDREFIGRNISNENVSFFVAQAGGDKSLILNRLSFTARDAKRNLSLPVDPIKDWEASVLKILKIIFIEPLEPKEEFDIIMQYNWPGAIGQEDYLIFTVSPYKLVDTAEFEIIFDAESKPNAWDFCGMKTGKTMKATEKIDTEHGELKLKYSLKDIGSENYRFAFHLS